MHHSSDAWACNLRHHVEVVLMGLFNGIDQFACKRLLPHRVICVRVFHSELIDCAVQFGQCIVITIDQGIEQRFADSVAAGDSLGHCLSPLRA